jgi:ApaG protein
MYWPCIWPNRYSRSRFPHAFQPMRANHKIRIDVSTSYLDDQSKPDEDRYVFSYTITIHNEGRVPAKLLTRHWLITDANGKVQEVRGDGVVGEQPHLQPGQGFRYSSGAVLETPVGAMQGSYQMVADDGLRFEAPIAPFRLAKPGLLH